MVGKIERRENEGIEKKSGKKKKREAINSTMTKRKVLMKHRKEGSKAMNEKEVVKRKKGDEMARRKNIKRRKVMKGIQDGVKKNLIKHMKN